MSIPASVAFHIQNQEAEKSDLDLNKGLHKGHFESLTSALLRFERRGRSVLPFLHTYSDGSYGSVAASSLRPRWDLIAERWPRFCNRGQFLFLSSSRRTFA